MSKHRDIKLAHKRLQLAWEHLDNEWPKRHPTDPKPFLSDVWRSADAQNALYAQGRKSHVETNALRAKAGLGPISRKENLRIVTRRPAGRGRHERTPSEAFDIAFVKKGSKTALDWSERLFTQAAKIVREFDPSLVWGGDWNQNWKTTDEQFIDMPHIQLK